MGNDPIGVCEAQDAQLWQEHAPAIRDGIAEAMRMGRAFSVVRKTMFRPKRDGHVSVQTTCAYTKRSEEQITAKLSGDADL